MKEKWSKQKRAIADVLWDLKYQVVMKFENDDLEWTLKVGTIIMKIIRCVYTSIVNKL